MSSRKINIPIKVEIYNELTEWEVNTGTDDAIVARRMKGKFRSLKWLGMSVWLLYFLVPYLRWNDHQAILFDIPKQQFFIFELTIFPQDIWMLSLTLLFFAILLAAVTSIAGRVFCGYFCFQTVWTEIFTMIEAKLEGDTPRKAQQFKQTPWNSNKVTRKVTKHILWLAISLFTGISFAAWFMDVFELWQAIFNFSAPKAVWIVLATFGFFTYWLAGFMREQVCFWLCPYARLQGVMYDQDTLLPAYDAERGEPRGKLSKEENSSQGSCIDCNVCVAVCPTGIDIRKGQQEGCITCGLCIDACDSIMDQIDQPRGLIRYASYKELHHDAPSSVLYKRPRFIVYSLIMFSSLVGIAYGFSHLPTTEFVVIHERQPLYVRLSDGSIQNKYTLKLLNKTKQPLQIQYQLSGMPTAHLVNTAKIITVQPGKIIPLTALVRVAEKDLKPGLFSFNFIATAINRDDIQVQYESVFISP